MDAGVEEGDEVPVHYDPMVAKLCTWGRTRDEAIARMRRALDEYDVAGIRTTIPFCRTVMDNSAFTSGAFDTGFVGEHFQASDLAPSPKAERTALLAAALPRLGTPPEAASETATRATVPASRWARRRHTGA